MFCFEASNYDKLLHSKSCIEHVRLIKSELVRLQTTPSQYFSEDTICFKSQNLLTKIKIVRKNLKFAHTLNHLGKQFLLNFVIFILFFIKSLKKLFD